MAVVQCKNKHYYDNEKYTECPHCSRLGVSDGSGSPVDVSENKTVAKFTHRQDDDGVDLHTMSLKNYSKQTDNDQKTVAMYFKEHNINPIAGWMVCTKGENKGRSFEIHIGKNFVGRSMRMDIHINDNQISRENHFSIIYDPKSRDFFVLQGNGITYYNGEVLSDAEQLREGDTIEAGASAYLFVPYCKEGRDWDD